MAAAPVFTGGSNLVVFEVRQLKGFGWQCCLCLNSAVGYSWRAEGLPFLLHWFQGQGARPQRIQSSACGQRVSPQSLLVSWDFLSPVSPGKLGSG